jgi:hypothetical protein
MPGKEVEASFVPSSLVIECRAGMTKEQIGSGLAPRVGLDLDLEQATLINEIGILPVRRPDTGLASRWFLPLRW